MSSWKSWLEPQVDGEEEAAARRILREVNEPRHDVTAVVHLRIKAIVTGDDEQVAAAHTQGRRADAERLQGGQALLRDIVRERDLADLHERSVKEIRARVRAARPFVVSIRA